MPASPHQQQYRHQQDRHSLKHDAGEHHLVLLKARRAGTGLPRFQLFLGRLEKGDNATDQREQRRTRRRDDKDHKKTTSHGHHIRRVRAKCQPETPRRAVAPRGVADRFQHRAIC